MTAKRVLLFAVAFCVCLVSGCSYTGINYELAPDTLSPTPAATFQAGAVSATPNPSPEPTQTPGHSAKPTPDEAPEPAGPTPVSAPEPARKPLEGLVIGLDPGHQGKGNAQQEPVAPGSDVTKKKVSSGTEGRFTKVPEHVVNLAVALKLRELLEDAGAMVIMTRESADADISNAQRAEMMNEAGADLVLRIHCNGRDDASVHGAFMLVPSNKLTDGINEESRAAGETILESFIKATGAKDLGITPRDDQTGFNWSRVPICNIEMGHMSNKEEDELLTSEDYQDKCALGLFNGIAGYFQTKG